MERTINLHKRDSDILSEYNVRLHKQAFKVRSKVRRIMDTEQEASEYLFNIYIEPWVKNFKGKRANTSSRLTPDVLIQCNSVREMKESLWGQFSNNLKGKAVIPSDLSIPCSVDASGVEPAKIDKFFVFQKNNRPFLLNESFSIRNLHVFSSVNRR